VPLRPSGSSLSPGKSQISSDSIAARVRDIRQAIERGSSKSALERAKQLHKEFAGNESKAILIDAYVARIEAMSAKDLTVEAKALADLVVSRFPESADRLAHLQRDLAARTGDVAALVAPLADSNATPDERNQARQTIRRELADVQALATCPSLPEDHPLRVSAAKISRVFEALTTGDIDDTMVAMAEVSHRSPLAGWKILIRAIMCLYRGRDQECKRHLDSIDKNCAPGLLADPIRAILSESPNGQSTKAVRRLVKRVSGPRIELRTALRSLDEKFSKGPSRALYRQIRQTVLLCERVCPQILERAKQHISVKAAVADCPVEAVIESLGGRSVHNAYFWRLFARARESNGEPIEACVLWNHFRNAAIEEDLFAADGPETAFLYVHMAELLSSAPPHQLRQMQSAYCRDPDGWEEYDDEDESPPYGSQSSSDGEEQHLYFLFPEKLYERASTLRPDANIYKDWLDYVETTDRSNLKPDDVALKWSEAFPADGRPLLHLAEYAEQRNAFNKALKFIEKAEKLGGIDPRVRRARLRLVVAKFARHIKQKKPNLAAKDLAEINELPQSNEKDRPCFIASLAWVLAMLQDNQAEADRSADKTRDLLGSSVSAVILMLSAANECRYSSAVTNELQKWLSAYKEKDLITAVTRTCPIGKDVNIEILLPARWKTLLSKWLKRSDCSLDNSGLLTMAEAALTSGWSEVAYYCCGYGLRSGGPEQARFMFLRGRSLPYFLDERRQDCFAAALALAKRVRDMDLVSEIVETSREDLGPWGWSSSFGPDLADISKLSTDDEAVERVTKFERRTRKYPTRAPTFGRGGRVANTQCQCPACRRARREAGAAAEQPYLFDDLFDDDDAEEDFTEQDLIQQASKVIAEYANIPPETANTAFEIYRLNGGKLPEGPDGLERFISEHPEMQNKVEQMLLQFSLQEAAGAFGEDFGEEDDFGYGSPGRPKRSRRQKKRRRRR
jgi:hypothetical protein